MRPKRKTLILMALALCLSGVAGMGQDEEKEAIGIRNYHLRALKAAGVSADGEGALELLRSLLPDSVDNDEIARLITGLGADRFADREAAELRLMRIGVHTVPALQDAKRSKEPEIAARAGRLIARVKRSRENLTPAIVGAFALIERDRPEGGVATVIRALPMLADKWAESQGLELLPTIATLADRASLEAVLKDGAPEPLLAAAIGSLAVILDTEELATLEPHIAAEQPESLQLAGAEALANRGYRPALEVLVRLLGSEDGTTRWKATNLIKAFTGKELTGKPYVEKYPAEQMKEIEEWLRQEGPKLKLEFPLKKVGLNPISGFIASSTSAGVIVYDRDGKEVSRIECSPYDAQALPGGEVLVCDRNDGRVIVFDPAGKERIAVGDISSPTDAELVSNGNLLVLENDAGRITEFDLKGKRVWSVDGLSNAYDVDRLPNGNTIVADSGNSRLVEFDRGGEVVWEKGGLDFPNGVLRLEDGRTLYTTYTSGGIAMLDPEGEQLWERVFDAATLYAIAISDGRIHVADGASGRILILEMDGANSDAIKLDRSFVDIGYIREE